MTTISDRELGATNASKVAADFTGQLQRTGLPEIQNIMNMVTGQMSGGFNSIMPMVKEQFDPIRSQMETEYTQMIGGSKAGIAQRAKQSGMPFGADAVDDATLKHATYLEQQRGLAENRLNIQEATANASEFQQLLSILGGGANTAIGLGTGNLQNMVGATGGMSQTSELGAIMSGVGTGMSILSMFG